MLRGTRITVSTHRGLPGVAAGLSSTTGLPTRPARRQVARLRLPPTTRSRAYKKSDGLRYAFARTSGEHRHLRRGLPRCARLPGRDPPPHGRPGDRHRQTPQFFRESAAQAWIENAAGAIRRCSTGRCRWPRTGSTATWSDSAVYRRAALEPRAADAHPLRRGRHRADVLRAAGPSLPPVVPRSASARATSTRSCGSSTGGAGNLASSSPATVVLSRWASGPAHLSGFFTTSTPACSAAGRSPPIVMLAFLPGRVGCGTSSSSPAAVSGFVVYRWHRARTGRPSGRWGRPRLAHVFSIWDGAWGRTMSWHPTRTRRRRAQRFRLWVIGWAAVPRCCGQSWPSGDSYPIRPSSRSCCSSACLTSPLWARHLPGRAA